MTKNLSNVIYLEKEDREAFCESLKNHTPPNENLKEAFEWYETTKNLSKLDKNPENLAQVLNSE
jgi:hypothetical protein